MSHSAEDMQRVSTWVAENCTPETIHILLSELAALRTQLTASEASRKELREALEVYASTYNEHWAAGMPILQPMSDAALANDAEQKGGAA